MTSSSAVAPALSGAAAFVQKVVARWRGGAAVALLVTIVLTLRFTLLGGGIYESRVIVALVPDAQASVNGKAEPLRGVLTQRVAAALPELAELQKRADTQGVVLDEAEGRLLLACRAHQPLAAHRRCAQLASRALRKLPQLRILQPASVPSQALPPTTATRILIVFASAWMGLTTGVLWMVGLALLPLSQRARDAERRRGHSSGAASARVLTIGRPEALGRGEVRTHKAQDSREPEALVNVNIAGSWQMDRSFDPAERPADLLRLCNQLYVAAAQQCFVVGISSEPQERTLKSRMAAQLAWLLARSEHARILLLELDFEFPSVDRVMNVDMPPRAGFSQQVHARSGDGAHPPWAVVRCTPHLSVLAEGRMRTPGVLHARQLAGAVDALRRHFDVIVAHGPTCDVEADKRALSEVVDGVVYVASAGDSDARAVARASARFDRRQLLAVVAADESEQTRS